MGPWMWGWGGYGYAGWWGIAMILFWVLIIVGIVLLIAWLVRGSQAQRPAGPSEDRALTLLRERFARGEISQEQFEQMRRTLQ